MSLVRRVEELDFETTDLPRLERPTHVLMADPRDFECAYAINPHMRDEEGRLKQVDRMKARTQWLAVRDAFESSGLVVECVPALDGHPDLVFCANPVFPIPRGAAADGRARVVPSRMAHAERRAEVAHVVPALERFGFAVEELRGDADRFEGTGDGLWHVDRALLWAGVGPRSSIEAWREIAERYSIATIALELVDPSLYHLDTALALLDERTCLWQPRAFDDRGRALVRALFERAIEVDDDEARRALAANAFCADGRRVFIEQRATRTIEKLRAAGFEPIALDTSEFLKSGGSVFCMKLAFRPAE